MSSAKKTALITGGAKGIGLGISQSLAGEGFDLALTGTSAGETVEQPLAMLSEAGVGVKYYQSDIADSESRSRLIDEIKNDFGNLHVLVNNAGVAPKRIDITGATEESFDWIIGINLKGPYFLTQLAANWMLEQKEASPEFQGCIINITSISSTMISINRGDYCISKAGLSMASQVWAMRLADHDIPVFDVRPGVTESPMTAVVKDMYDKKIADGLIPQNRWGKPEDVGKAVAMLARGDLAFSTGQPIYVDGGHNVVRL